MADTTTLSAQQILDSDLGDWRQLLQGLQTRFATGDFATGLALLNAIGAEAEERNHHPDLDLRYTHLDIRLLSHDVGGVTERDIALARRISELAAQAQVSAQPEAAQALELALDTPDHAAVAPFWAAILGRDHEPGADDTVDPDAHLPNLWFQGTDSTDPDRQRFHLDVIVGHDHAQARIDAALAAGGHLVSDDRAPAFWVLADADGNQACICTPLGRD